MRFPNGGRPPTASDAADGPRIERFPGRLSNYSTPRPCPAQSIPRERLAYLARQIHPLGERTLHELFIELEAGGQPNADHQVGPAVQERRRP
jgi:hypothetical protein